MKIVYSIGSIANSGGIERVLCTKANYFADILDYEIHIIVLNDPGKTFFPFSKKIHIHSLGIERIIHKPWMVFGSRSRKEYQKKLFQKLEEIRPDITISVFGLDAEFLYKATDGSKKVLEFHFTKNYLRHLGNALINDKYRLIRKIWLEFLLAKERYYARKYQHIVLLTEKDKFLWGGRKKFTVIPNPLSFETEHAAPLTNQQIISMGRLVAPKGFQYLIRAFALLKKDFPDWKLHIYGEGHDQSMLLTLIKELSLSENIMIAPPTQNTASVLLSSSIFVLSSLYDGFGLVLTEAMECGVPCVAFDCECGPSEIITDKKDGFLVRLRDVNELSEQMKLLMSDKVLRLKMGEAAKQNVKRFGVGKVMNRWVEFFEEIK